MNGIHTVQSRTHAGGRHGGRSSATSTSSMPEMIRTDPAGGPRAAVASASARDGAQQAVLAVVADAERVVERFSMLM